MSVGNLLLRPGGVQGYRLHTTELGQTTSLSDKHGHCSRDPWEKQAMQSHREANPLVTAVEAPRRGYQLHLADITLLELPVKVQQWCCNKFCDLWPKNAKPQGRPPEVNATSDLNDVGEHSYPIAKAGSKNFLPLDGLRRFISLMRRALVDEGLEQI